MASMVNGHVSGYICALGARLAGARGTPFLMASLTIDCINFFASAQKVNLFFLITERERVHCTKVANRFLHRLLHCNLLLSGQVGKKMYLCQAGTVQQGLPLDCCHVSERRRPLGGGSCTNPIVSINFAFGNCQHAGHST